MTPIRIALYLYMREIAMSVTIALGVAGEPQRTDLIDERGTSRPVAELHDLEMNPVAEDQRQRACPHYNPQRNALEKWTEPDLLNCLLI